MLTKDKAAGLLAQMDGIEHRHRFFEEKLQRALKTAVPKAGIHEPVSVHTLCHSFATHFLQSHTDIRAL